MKTLEIEIGRLEAGSDLVIDLLRPYHAAVQGMTRSGKSVVAYNILGRLAPRRDVVMAGLDPTGVLLGPWVGHPYPELRAVGSGDMSHHVDALEAVCAEMDRRIGSLLTRRRDKAGDEYPTIVVVFEEYAGVLALAAAQDKAEGRRAIDRLEPAIAAHFLRLVQEGAKVGIRVVVLCQRMDASIIGGAARSSIGTRITMKVDNGDAVRMLHPDASIEDVSRIRCMEPGVGVIETYGTPMARFKADLVEYNDYVDAVDAGAEKRRSADVRPA